MISQPSIDYIIAASSGTTDPPSSDVERFRRYMINSIDNIHKQLEAGQITQEEAFEMLRDVAANYQPDEAELRVIQGKGKEEEDSDEDNPKGNLKSVK